MVRIVSWIAGREAGDFLLAAGSSRVPENRLKSRNVHPKRLPGVRNG